MPKTNLASVARGLLADGLISYIAIIREKGYEARGLEALGVWADTCREMSRRAMEFGMLGSVQPDNQVDALLLSLNNHPDDDPDDHLEVLIEERRGLIRETMRQELDDIEDAGLSQSDG